LISGAAEATSDTMYGIVTYAKTGRTTEVSVFGKDGKEVDYLSEDRAELAGLASGKDYFNSKYALIKYKLNSDGEIAEGKWTYADIDATTMSDLNSVDGDGNPTKPSKDDASIYDGDLDKDADKKVIDLSGRRFYLTSDTIVMKALDDKGKLDPEVINIDKFISLDISDDNEAVVFGESGKNAKFIVLLNKDFEGSEDDILYGVVTDGTWRASGDDYSEIDVFGEGKVDYKVDSTTDFAEAKVVAFKINNKDEATTVAGKVYSDATYTYKDNFITVAGEGTFKVDSDAVIYSLDDGDIDKKISVSKLNNYKKITYALEDGLVVAAVVSEESIGGKTPESGLAANTTHTGTIKAKSNIDMTLKITADVDSEDYEFDVTSETQFIDSVNGEVFKGIVGLAKVSEDNHISFRINNDDELTIVEF